MASRWQQRHAFVLVGYWLLPVCAGHGMGIPGGEMAMSLDMGTSDAVCDAVDRDRLLRTAVELVDIPSPTRSALQVADHLATLLGDAGF